MTDRDVLLIKAVLTAPPCQEHGEQRCLYGCAHSRRDECHGCALNAAVAVELAIAKYEQCQKEGCQDDPFQEGSVYCKRCGKYLGFRSLKTGEIIR